MTTKPRRRVLAAETDPAALRLIQITLEGESFEVVAVNNGRAALRALTHDSFIAAAFLALGLNDINALELLRRLKSDARPSRVPVAVTVGGDVGLNFRADCYAAGAAALLPKPFTKSQLLSVIRLVTARAT